jgi:hypothetical protein
VSRWWWLAGGLVVGYLIGHYAAPLSQLWGHRDQISDAGDVISGVSQAWGGLEKLWHSVSATSN